MLESIFEKLREDLRESKLEREKGTIERKPTTKHHEFYTGIHYENELPFIRVVLEKKSLFHNNSLLVKGLR